MLGCYIDGGGEEWPLTGYAGDVGDSAGFIAGQEMGDGELGHADWVCEVDV